MLLVPTRELALQTAQVAKELGKHLAAEIMVTTGGTSLKVCVLRCVVLFGCFFFLPFILFFLLFSFVS